MKNRAFVLLIVFGTFICGCKKSEELELEEVFLTKFLYGERVHIDSLVYNYNLSSLSKGNKVDELVIEGFFAAQKKVFLPVASLTTISNKVTIRLDFVSNIIPAYYFDKNDTLIFFAQKDTIQKKWLSNFFLNELDYYFIVNGRKYYIRPTESTKVFIDNRNFIKI